MMRRRRFQINPNTIAAVAPKTEALSQQQTSVITAVSDQETIPIIMEPPIKESQKFESNPTEIIVESQEDRQLITLATLNNVSTSSPITSPMASPTCFKFFTPNQSPQKILFSPTKQNENSENICFPRNNFTLEGSEDTDTIMSVASPMMSLSARTNVDSDDVASTQTNRRKRTAKRDEELDPKKFTLADLIDWRPKTENTLRKKWDDKRQQMLEIMSNGSGIAGDLTDEPTSSSKLNNNLTNEPPAPRVKINEQGEMVIDEESLLVVENQDLSNWETVDDNCMPKKLNSMSFRKNRRTKLWCRTETDLFYEVLAATGTDFTLMHEFLPMRSRAEIKKKFNREEKLNVERINMCLRYPTLLDNTLYDRVKCFQEKILQEETDKLAKVADKRKEMVDRKLERAERRRLEQENRRNVITENRTKALEKKKIKEEEKERKKEDRLKIRQMKAELLERKSARLSASANTTMSSPAVSE